MKKIFFTALAVFSFCVAYSIDIYDLHFPGLNGQQISMSNYVNKQIIIVGFDASNPNKAELQFFDSVYRQSANLIVIAIPLADFGTSLDAQKLNSLLTDSFKISFPIASTSNGKRGSNQHPLMKWMTTTSAKNHFDTDLSKDAMVYIFNNSGILYAILASDIFLNVSLLKQVLGAQPN